MNRDPSLYSDVCFGKLLREEQRLTTQATLQHQLMTSDAVAYVAHGKNKWRDMRKIQCFSCKDYGHIATHCTKKYCNYCKKSGHIIKDCPTRPQNRQANAYQATTGPSTSKTSSTTTQSALTPEMVQQMIASAFAALGLQGKHNTSSQSRLVDSSTSNQMTSPSDGLHDIRPYQGSSHIQIANGSHLAINAVGSGVGKDTSGGPKIGRLFPLHFSIPSCLSLACITVNNKSEVWHKRLGHPNSTILSYLLNSGLLVVMPKRALILCIVMFRAFQLSPLLPSGEYMSHEFHDFLKQKGILSQRSCPYTPQQNGVVERKNRHVLDVVRTLLLDSHVPSTFWVEAVSTAVYLINRLPSQILRFDSPYYRLHNQHPTYHDLHTFGCICFVHLSSHERHKLSAQSVKCAFMGYSVSHKGYVCYYPCSNRFRIFRNVVFFEQQSFFHTHAQHLPEISILPCFDDLTSHPERFKPGLVYERRQPNRPLPEVDLTSDLVQPLSSEPELASDTDVPPDPGHR
ncbi:uncharacterized protein LOC111366879 [Olea europaea var. sylvestris]|uniref:uncharacterized protein LOC111366879 n=1 Tax=Olea europaea var. sylvestris TaxID=158386 RepID=UPI000C1D3096|nr:uncharacterized protein LOC111366879 [Olea europaea var. sylvestris]